MATKKKKPKPPASASKSAVTKKSYTYTLSMHAQDSFQLSIAAVIGPVAVTNSNPGVARAVGQGGKNFMLTIAANGPGKTTITAKGRTSSTAFTFKFTVTVKFQPVAAKPPEQLPSEIAVLPLVQGAKLTALYHQLTVIAPTRIAGKATVKVAGNAVTATAPGPNIPLVITPVQVGNAKVTVAIEFLTFRSTGAPAPQWGTGAPASVQGAPTKTTVLTGAGPSYSDKLVQVKQNFDFKSRLNQTFLITVVACPDCGAGALF
jgi:hypothetical protein